MSDPINPDHYRTKGVECIEALEAMGVANEFCTGNVIKYLWRLGAKGDPLEDAKKARWYLERLIKNLEHAVAQRIEQRPSKSPSAGSTPAGVNNGEK